MRRIYVKSHYIIKHGRRIKIKGYYRRVLGTRKHYNVGGRTTFQGFAKRVAKEYKRKGYSTKRARAIGRKTAGKVFWVKYGKKRGRKIIKKAIHY